MRKLIFIIFFTTKTRENVFVANFSSFEFIMSITMTLKRCLKYSAVGALYYSVTVLSASCSDAVLRNSAGSRRNVAYKPHLLHLDGSRWFPTDEDVLGTTLDGIFDNGNSTFIFHGMSGAGKSSLVETICYLDEGSISGHNVEGATGHTRTAKRYSTIHNYANTKYVHVIDTPGLGESEKHADMVLEGIEDSIKLAISHTDAPVRQVYFMILPRCNKLANQLKSLIRLYGDSVKDYITLVISQADASHDPEPEITKLKNGVKEVAATVLGRKPEILFVSSKDCMIQLSEHMVLSSKKAGADFSGYLPFRQFRKNTELFVSEMDIAITAGKKREKELQEQSTKEMWSAIGLSIGGAVCFGAGACFKFAPSLFQIANGLRYLSYASMISGIGTEIAHEIHKRNDYPSVVAIREECQKRRQEALDDLREIRELVF
jgi:GTP-binding protein EngB required for normal cell division